MDPLLIDTHTHVNFNAFKDDGDEVVRRTLEARTWMFNVGSQYNTSKRAVEYADRHPAGVYAIIGLHPVHLFAQHVDEKEDVHSYETREENFDYDAYKKLAAHPRVIGIGECGLEYFHLPEGKENEAKIRQKEVFEEQIRLAAETGKVLMVHCRDAYDDLYEMLKAEIGKLRGAVIHSFIGSWTEAEKFLSIGCYLGFNGIITYKPKKERVPGGSDPSLQDVVRQAPMDRIVLETDAPYLSPEPRRGQRNEPRHVSFVAKKIAELKKINSGEVAEQSTKNARSLFGV